VKEKNPIDPQPVLFFLAIGFFASLLFFINWVIVVLCLLSLFVCVCVCVCVSEREREREREEPKI